MRGRVRSVVWGLFIAGAVLAGFVFASCGALEPAPSEAAAAAGGPATAPDFTLLDIVEGQRNLQELLRGGPVLLEFMSPDCPHCRDMAPILTRLCVALRGRVQFVTVAFDQNIHRVRRFVEREKHTWPYLMGNQNVARAYRLDGVPAFFLIAQDGRILFRQIGSTSQENMARGIEEALGKR